MRLGRGLAGICAMLVTVFALLSCWSGTDLSKSLAIQTQALYRAGHGDFEYFPILAAWANGKKGELQTMDGQRAGVVPFSSLPILPYSFFIKLLGDWGWLLADIFCYVGYFAAFFLIFRPLLDRASQAVIAAIWMTLGTFASLSDVLVSAMHLPSLGVFGIETRLPRPFISDLYYLFAVGCLISIKEKLREGSFSPIFFLCVGASLSLATQANLFVGTFLLPVSLIFIASAFTLPFPDVRKKKMALFWTLGAFVSFALPSYWQSRAISAEQWIRMGVVPVSRDVWKALSPTMRNVFEVALIIFCLFFFRRWMKSRVSYLLSKRLEGAISGILFLWVLVFFSLIAASAFVLVTGKVFQMYHFSQEVHRAWGLASAMTLITILIRLADSLPWVWKSKALSSLVLSLLFLLPPVILLREVPLKRKMQSDHLGSDASAYGSFPSSYRQNLMALVAELRQPRYRDMQVLGSFDQQLNHFWITFEKKYVYLPTAWTSVASDSELEDRLISFSQQLGLTADEFISLLTNRFSGRADPSASDSYLFAASYLGGLKYAVNSVTHRYPLTDYASRHQLALTTLPVEWSWYIAIPNSELIRLHKKYLATLNRRLPFQLDLIVTFNYEPWTRFVPKSMGYEETYQNPIFRVYQRGKLDLAKNVND